MGTAFWFDFFKGIYSVAWANIEAILSVFSVGFTQLPVGVYGTSFIAGAVKFSPIWNLLLGAVYGRIYGEIVKIIFPDFPIEPGAYAVIGTPSCLRMITS